MRFKIDIVTVIVFINLLTGACNRPSDEPEAEDEMIEYQKKLDVIAGERIDSAYKKIAADCDTARIYQLPLVTDSLLQLKKDSARQ